MKKKKTISSGSIIFLILLFVGALMGEAGSDAGVMLLSLTVVIVALFLVLRAASKKAGKSSSGRSRSAKGRPEDPRMKTFTKPDAPCIVCEHTGENHLERDRINRLRQLDEWLKIGLIEKEEYRILRERYQQSP